MYVCIGVYIYTYTHKHTYIFYFLLKIFLKILLVKELIQPPKVLTFGVKENILQEKPALLPSFWFFAFSAQIRKIRVQVLSNDKGKCL